MEPLIDAHCTHLRAAGRSPRTVNDRHDLLVRLDKSLPHGLAAASTAEIESAFAAKSWGRWTRCTYYTHLSGFFGWATSGSHPYLSHDPMAGLATPRPPRRAPNPVSDDELRLSLVRSSARWQLIIMLCASVGARPAEIPRMDRDDVSPEFVRLHGKGDRVDLLPTRPDLWAMVEHLPDGPLVRSRSGGRIQGSLPVAARQHFNRIDLPRVHLRRFRAWFATSMLLNGVDIRTVQELMRHESVSTTAAYLKITSKQRRHAVTTLPLPTITGPLRSAA